MSGGERGSGSGGGGDDIEAGRRSREEGEGDGGEELREVKQSAFEEEREERIDNEGREDDVEGRNSPFPPPPTDSKGGNTEGTEGARQGEQSAAAAAGSRAVSDPISESYRSIVEVINRTSDGFREGKKWKCVAGTPISRAESRQQQQQQQQYQYVARPRELRRSHKHRGKRSTMTRSHTAEEGSRGGGGAAATGKRLVRQAACATEDATAAAASAAQSSVSAGNVCSAETQRLLSAPSAARLRGRSLPVRQWTVDASCPPAIGQAYLLRPVSRSSIKSSTSGGGDDSGGGRRLSPGDLQSSSGRAKIPARSPMAERIRAASFNVETNEGGATVSVRSSRSGSGRTTLSATRNRIKKQRTCDSAPKTSAAAGGAPATFGGSNRHLPRQFSNASAYSAAASAFIPTSLSHQGMTLVRGASCSLVDIPTYLGPSYGGVELAQICDVRMAAAVSTAAAAAATATVAVSTPSALEESAADLSQQRKNARPRLQVNYWGA